LIINHLTKNVYETMSNSGKLKKVYFAISYSNRKLFDKEVKGLLDLFHKNHIQLQVFVDEYNFKETQEKEMMKTAFAAIDNADLLIAELTTKSIGVGIEIGYAAAKKKPIFYIRKKGADYSTTASGSSTTVIEYENVLDLLEKTEKKLGLLFQK